MGDKKQENNPNLIDEIIKTAVERYQCPGCVCGSDTQCYRSGDSEACGKHVAGTLISNIGRVFLGMPKGFDRLGLCDKTKIDIFRELVNGWGYDLFNVPIWKFRDEYGNVLVRGLCPRTNYPWIHIFLSDCMQEIDCIELSEKNISSMA